VGGLCAVQAGTIPEKGTKLPLEDGTVLEVLDASPRRVRSVRIHLPPREASEG
jgi:putative hemolysin